MQRNKPTAVTYDTALMVRDMAERGWLNTDLARAAKVSDMTVTRFFRGVQTARTADKLARALGRTTRRYMRPLRQSEVA